MKMFKSNLYFLILTGFLVSCSQSSNEVPPFTVTQENVSTQTERYIQSFNDWLQSNRNSGQLDTSLNQDGLPLFADRQACGSTLSGAPTIVGGANRVGQETDLSVIASHLAQLESNPDLEKSWSDASSFDETFEAESCGERSAFARSRKAGTQPKIGAICGGEYPIPCILNAGRKGKSRGCCQQCFAQTCWGLYRNGVICTSRNTPGKPWLWCSGKPRRPIIAWICPCI